MNKKVEGAMLITAGLVGGSIVGSTYVIVRGLKDDDIRDAIVQKLSRKVADVVYPKQSDKISYRSYYDEKCKPGYTPYKKYGGELMIYDSRESAEQVLFEMKDIIYKYGICTIADMQDLSGCQTSVYTDSMYGWTCLKDATVKRTSRGYIIDDLPRPRKLY